MLQAKEIPVLGSPVDTKQKIFDAARELFALHGFDAVSMRDIANKVGIRTSSIYYHYDKKRRFNPRYSLLISKRIHSLFRGGVL